MPLSVDGVEGARTPPWRARRISRTRIAPPSEKRNESGRLPTVQGALCHANTRATLHVIVAHRTTLAHTSPIDLIACPMDQRSAVSGVERSPVGRRHGVIWGWSPAKVPLRMAQRRSRLHKTSSMGQRLRVAPLAQHLFDLGDVQFLVADHLTSQLFERHAATLGQNE